MAFDRQIDPTYEDESTPIDCLLYELDRCASARERAIITLDKSTRRFSVDEYTIERQRKASEKKQWFDALTTSERTKQENNYTRALLSQQQEEGSKSAKVYSQYQSALEAVQEWRDKEILSPFKYSSIYKGIAEFERLTARRQVIPANPLNRTLASKIYKEAEESSDNLRLAERLVERLNDMLDFVEEFEAKTKKTQTTSSQNPAT